MQKVTLYLQKILLLFPLFLIFFFIPNPHLPFANDGYLPRAYGMMGFAAIATFLLFIFKTSGQSAVQFFQHQKPAAWVWFLLAYGGWVILSNALAPLGGIGMTGSPILGYGGLEIACGLLLILVYNQLKNTEPLLKILSVCCLFIVAISLLESIGFRPLKHWVYGNGLVYPVATISIRQHLAGWFAIFTGTAILFWQKQNLRPWLSVMLFSSIVGVALCKNSATSLALFIQLFAWALYSVQKYSLREIALSALISFLVLVLLLPGALSQVGRSIGFTPYETKDYRSTVTLQTRLLLWKGALIAAEKRPLSGWGDETFSFELFNNLSQKDGDHLIHLELSIPDNYKFIRSGTVVYYYPPNNPKLTKSNNLIYVRAHSALFDELYSHGFVGLALLLALIISLILAIPKNYRLLFIIACCSYPISLLALFYVPSVTPLYTLVLGIALREVGVSPFKTFPSP